METKQIIEVNGIRYDAISGKVLGAGTGASYRPTRNIDGFFRARTLPAHGGLTTAPPTSRPSQTASMGGDIITVATPKPVIAPQPITTVSRQLNHARAHMPQASRRLGIQVRNETPRTEKLTVRRSPTTANHVQPHATQGTTTLMRTLVMPPLPSFHKQARTKAELAHPVPSLIVPKRSAFHVDAERFERAKNTPRSPLIGRHEAKATSILPIVEPLAVQTAPAPSPQDNQPPLAPPPTPTNKPAEDIFEHALANATHFVDAHAHNVRFKQQTRRHLASISAGVLALFVIAGFTAYQNMPGIQFKVASIRAGVASSMPDFKAAGFAFGGVKAGDGKLYIGLSRGNSKYQLTQQPTNLSAADMIANVGGTNASGFPTYTTIRVGHTDVYQFNNTDATWIADGQWYTLTGTKALSDTQLSALVQHI